MLYQILLNFSIFEFENKGTLLKVKLWFPAQKALQWYHVLQLVKYLVPAFSSSFMFIDILKQN